MVGCKDIEQKPDETVDSLFGFPIVWTEGIPVGTIVLADWSGWAHVRMIVTSGVDDEPE